MLRQGPAAPLFDLLEDPSMFFAALGFEDMIPLMVFAGIVAGGARVGRRAKSCLRRGCGGGRREEKGPGSVIESP